MSRHNKYLLSLLTFIAKCANVSDVDLDAAVESFGLQIVVHGQAETPPAQLRRTGSSASQAGRGLTQRGNRTGCGSRGGQTGGLALVRRTSMSPGGPGAAGRAITAGSGGGGGGGRSLSRRVTEDPFALEALQSPSINK